MPIYEFECHSCNKVFEERMSMSDPTPENCPFCGKAKISKLMSRSAFQLKGGGWYSDGYDTASNKRPEASSAPAAPSAAPVAAKVSEKVAESSPSSSPSSGAAAAKPSSPSKAES